MESSPSDGRRHYFLFTSSCRAWCFCHWRMGNIETFCAAVCGTQSGRMFAHGSYCHRTKVTIPTKGGRSKTLFCHSKYWENICRLHAVIFHSSKHSGKSMHFSRRNIDNIMDKKWNGHSILRVRLTKNVKGKTEKFLRKNFIKTYFLVERTNIDPIPLSAHSFCACVPNPTFR